MQWRAIARKLLADGIAPEAVHWDDPLQGSLFAREASSAAAHDSPAAARPRIPARLLTILEDACCHRTPRRVALMYRALWRATHGHPAIVDDVTDDDMRALLQLQHDVQRDSHKMTAFVRFRELRDDAGSHSCWIAWYEPAHRILERVAPFFVKRFGAMQWTIATPDGIAAWDRVRLQLLPPDASTAPPPEDAGEALWLAYYQAIFNPARLNVRAMQKEMPQRYWTNLPEARLIPALVASASQRAGRMAEQVPRIVAVRPLPERSPVYAGEHDAGLPGPAQIDGCRRCPLWEHATRGVCGAGAADARVMVVGEQPGDEEDLQGKPFVGPAGRLLGRALDAAHVDRERIYVTNAVKHFSWEPRGKRRIHKTPGQRAIEACRTWLEAEVAHVRPDVILALGSTALQSLLAARLKVGEARGRDDLRHPGGARVVPTWHPAAVLRAADAGSEAAMFAALVADLRRASDLAGTFTAAGAAG